MGRLGATVAGTDPCSTGGHPKTSTERKRRLQMNKFRFTINALAIAIFMFAFASFAQAQATRTWVSGVGDDANPCSRTAPCKTFAGAISKTAPSGEIDALDPGGFGAVTITKSITIDGGGGQVASVLVSGTNGIVIAGASTDVINLVNLRFQGLNHSGLSAIKFNSGNALNVINCYIWGFVNGIEVSLNQATNATVFVKDSVVKNCSTTGMLLTQASTGQVRASIARSSFVEGGRGLEAKTGPATFVSAMNSDFSGNGGIGVFANSTNAGGIAVISLLDCQVSGNFGRGVQAGNGGNVGTSVVRIGRNLIDFNQGGGVLVSTGGTIETFVNNSIRGNNGSDGCTGCSPVNPGT